MAGYLCLIQSEFFQTDLCRSIESDCPPRYCGSPTLWNFANVNCQCNRSCTGESNTVFAAKFLLLEPFVFGDWEETKECNNCFLKMERHCEPVALPGQTPPSCEDQNTTMAGNTPCSRCEGDDLSSTNNQTMH